MRWFLACCLVVGCAAPRPLAPPEMPVHTYSIVARDLATGDFGVAVESHYFSVGSVVPWAKAGVGAVATQSFAEPAYGPRALMLLQDGQSAPDALAALIAQDPLSARRQVAVVDARGRVAAHTGKGCIAWAGHLQGEGYSVQANMMLNERVVPAMAKAFESTKGVLAERLVAALEAAQAAGGDIRGQQSAALLVVRGKPTGRSWEDVLVDLRVEDHPEPIRELRRLWALHTAYRLSRAGDADRAIALAPGNRELPFWSAISLARQGAYDQAAERLRPIVAEDPNWSELLRRLVPAGLLEEGHARALLDRLESGAGK